MAALTQNKIRIRLKAYDSSSIETAAKEIVETANRTGATVSGPVPLPTEKNVYCVIRSPVQGQGLARALRDPHAQAADRHPSADPEDGRLAPATRPPPGRRRHPDPADLAMPALLGKKLGMTQVFQEDGRVERVTVVEAGPCHVTGIRTHDRDGYEAVQLAFGEVKEKRLNKARARPPEEGRRRQRCATSRSSATRPASSRSARPSPSRSSRRARSSRSPPSRRARASRARSSATTSRAAPSPTARTTCAPRARSAPRPRRRACSRASAARARWATSASPRTGLDGRRRDRPTRTCCCCAAPCRARRAARSRSGRTADGQAQGSLHRQEPASTTSTSPCSARSSTWRSCTRPRAPS